MTVGHGDFCHKPTQHENHELRLHLNLTIYVTFLSKYQLQLILGRAAAHRIYHCPMSTNHITPRLAHLITYRHFYRLYYARLTLMFSF